MTQNIPLSFLQWDSDFFKSRIFSIKISSSTVPDLRELISELNVQKADMTYVFVEDEIPDWQKKLVDMGACLYDEKVTFGKVVPDPAPATSENVIWYTGDLNKELEILALFAGFDSRFKKDKFLRPYFESFYKLWMSNSLNGAIADRVFVYREGSCIEGMVTCKIKNGVGSIGLIAVNEGTRGKGIGSKLINASDVFYQSNGIRQSTVVTQATNIQACRFYEKTGFKIIKREYVYHWWFK